MTGSYKPRFGKAAPKKPVLGKPGVLTAGPGYDVGYGKPPEDARFRKGVSGNPKGRPKGSKNQLPTLHEERMKSIILQEAYRTIPVREGDKNVTVPIATAVMRSIAVNAVKGQSRAQRLFSELLSAVETSNKARHNEWLEVAITYKADWEHELERRRIHGITGLPDPVPHPDHIKIDFYNDEVRVIGPFTGEEKRAWDALFAKKPGWEEDLRGWMEELAGETDSVQRRFIQSEIDQCRTILDLFTRAEKGDL